MLPSRRRCRTLGADPPPAAIRPPPAARRLPAALAACCITAAGRFVGGQCQAAGMGRLSSFDTVALANLLRHQHSIIRRDQAIACGLSETALRHRLRADGPWQTLLPGVYLVGRAALASRQRAAAAFLYASRPIAITGPAALAWHGIGRRYGSGAEPCVGPEYVDVLVEHRSRRRDVGFARLHRTCVVPNVAFRDGSICFAPPARAVADAARFSGDIADVRAVVAAGVQQRKVQVWQLAEELSQGPARGSARLRAALAEVADGVRSVAEADLRDLIKRERLPMPVFNPRLFVGEEFLATPDAWWPDAGVAVEVDSREWHLSPADWEHTMARHARMSAFGIIVLHYPPSRIRAKRREVAGQIRSALDAAGDRRFPQVRALPAR
jgi:hypothetical protein